ncbi:PREDICTED: glutaredoxin-C9-like [Nicotiana attenuata]|uniref:Glutaredoxin-c9 n=1 Tax=Nicotiana attenuata TaxID=49451 RepID=A0A1J6IQB0_NICAT|nr:PREDICTED: glutaredoxin-C9-like [Nicotiana attenuata]OIS97320.1 glutaredoxin-c9 [Nicotiana attenuata]
MQEALPYKSWQHFPTDFRTLNKSSSLLNQESKGDVKNMIKENAVIVFGRRGCCMSHVIQRLLHFLGVNPVIYDIEEKYENEVVVELEDIGGVDRKDGGLQLPAVFIGGELFGGLDRIMAAHISGELTPVLKQAGALWL